MTRDSGCRSINYFCVKNNHFPTSPRPLRITVPRNCWLEIPILKEWSFRKDYWINGLWTPRDLHIWSCIRQAWIFVWPSRVLQNPPGCHSSWTLKGLFASGRVWGSKHRSSQAMTGRQWYLVIFWRMCWGLVWSIPAEMFPGSPNITNVFWMIHIQKNSWSYPGAKYSPRGLPWHWKPTYIVSMYTKKWVTTKTRMVFELNRCGTYKQFEHLQGGPLPVTNGLINPYKCPNIYKWVTGVK